METISGTDVHREAEPCADLTEVACLRPRLEWHGSSGLGFCWRRPQSQVALDMDIAPSPLQKVFLRVLRLVCLPKPWSRSSLPRRLPGAEWVPRGPGPRDRAGGRSCRRGSIPFILPGGGRAHVQISHAWFGEFFALEHTVSYGHWVSQSRLVTPCVFYLRTLTAQTKCAVLDPPIMKQSIVLLSWSSRSGAFWCLLRGEECGEWPDSLRRRLDRPSYGRFTCIASALAINLPDA